MQDLVVIVKHPGLKADDLKAGRLVARCLLGYNLLMQPETKPSVIVFDVNETLLDIDTLKPLFERLFGDGRMSVVR